MWAHEGDDVGSAGSSRPDDGVLPVGQPLVRSRARPPSGPSVGASPVPVRPGPSGPSTDGHHPVGPGTVRAEPAPEPIAATDRTGRPLAVGLVVGAGSPLGAAFTDTLRARGTRVCLLDDDAVAVRSAVGDDPDVMVLRCDLSRPDDLLDAVGFLHRAGVRIDLLVQASPPRRPAGDGYAAPSARELDERYRREVSGPLWLLEEAAPLLRPGATVVVADRPAAAAGDDDPVEAARNRAVQVARDALGERAGVLRVVSSGNSPTEDRAAAALALDLLELDRLQVTAVEVRPVGPVGTGGSLPA